MQCPSCQNSNPAGQKFCGRCGHKLEASCPRCEAANPPNYKFCGQCGAALVDTGAITLAKSGLITSVNPKALAMLGCKERDMQGKPFSLFVDRTDMAVFFTHWNDLIRSAKNQSFEISLKHKEGHTVYTVLDCSAEKSASQAVETVRLRLTEDSKNRLEAIRLQSQQDLLGLIFTVTNNICNVSSRHETVSIEDALKKTSLYTQADLCFIYGINRVRNSLDNLYEWRREEVCRPLDCERLKNASVPLKKVKHIILKLRQEKMVVIDNTADLGTGERDELTHWLNLNLGAIIYYLIYAGKTPIGIIGAARVQASGRWPSDSASLVRFLGDFLADRLPVSSALPRTASRQFQGEGLAADARDASGDAPQTRSHAEEPRRKIVPDMTLPMLYEKYDGDPPLDQQKVFLRDDNLVLLTCPNCGLQDSVSLSRFEKLGNTIRVNCSCRKPFAAVLEKRRYFRKSVRLGGYFSLSDDLHPGVTGSSIWGEMMVMDLSKAGLRFSSEKAHLVRQGDLLMVRFNLDNTNKALIHKPARVITIAGNSVGCRFEGDDNYDITLGFYFM